MPDAVMHDDPLRFHVQPGEVGQHGAQSLGVTATFGMPLPAAERRAFPPGDAGRVVEDRGRALRPARVRDRAVSFPPRDPRPPSAPGYPSWPGQAAPFAGKPPSTGPMSNPPRHDHGLLWISSDPGCWTSGTPEEFLPLVLHRWLEEPKASTTTGPTTQKSLALASWCARTGQVASVYFRRTNRPSLLMVAHQLAKASEVTSSEHGIHSVFSVPSVPFERANRTAGKKRNEFRSTTPRLRVLGKGQNWLMVAHQLASAYIRSLKREAKGQSRGREVLAVRWNAFAGASGL